MSGTAPRRRRCCRARDAPLVEQERLDGRAPARAPARAALPVEPVLERLDADAGGEERVARRVADRELTGAEAARIAEAQPVAVVELEAHALAAHVRLGVVEQRPGHAQVHDQVDLALERHHEVLAAAVEPLDPPALDRGGQLPGSSGSHQRGSRTSSAASMRPSRRGASARRIVSTSGSSGTAPQDRSGRVSRTAGPGCPVRSMPRTSAARCADVGHRAVCAAPRDPAVPGQQRDALARVVAVLHRGIDAVVGGQHEQVPVAQRRQPAADGRVDLAQRAVEAIGVLAMAVELVGLDQVRDDDPGVELRDEPGQRRQRRGIRRALVRASKPRPANRSETFPTPWTATPAACAASRCDSLGGASE